MPTGRAVLLLRRLSTGDNRFKNINNLNQNTTTKELVLTNPVCSHKDLCLAKRFGNLPKHQMHRSFSHSEIKMKPAGDSTPSAKKPKYTNSLINEKSPYLLQHAHNPVEWYTWGQEAFDKAKREDKLIFLSVGCSTCHWCHTMQKESFENEDTAKIMNEHFINIKVDREERPDVDSVYMQYIMASTNQGGWPMSVFLTPDLRPVSGGTYYPPIDLDKKPGFKTVLRVLSEKWKQNRQHFYKSSSTIISALIKVSSMMPANSLPDVSCWNELIRMCESNYEPKYGGIGIAPKFPQASILSFLFHYYARDKNNPVGKQCLDMCLHTLTKMAQGGIYDHVGGGFGRYSVDAKWHVPHFEKMLYDQAQLVVAYTDAYLASKDESYADVVRDVIKYVTRDLRHETGGFYCAEDADSYPNNKSTEKKQGAFYVWTSKEIKSLLQELNSKKPNLHFNIFVDYFNIKDEGNIPDCVDVQQELRGKNVLFVENSKADIAEKYNVSLDVLNQILAESVAILYEARLKRPRPQVDTKMLCCWNGLMISGLARAGQGLGEKIYIDEAIKTASFIEKYMYDSITNTLTHVCYKADEGSVITSDIKGFLDDYAYLIRGLLDLYEASFDSRWLNWARDLQTKQNELFWDNAYGGYFGYTTDDDSILMRLKPSQDSAEPSGNSVACHNLLRLAVYADKSSANGGENERTMATSLLKYFASKLTETPLELPELMSAFMLFHDSPTQVLISGEKSDPRTLALVRAVRSRLVAGRVLCVAEPAGAEAPPVLARMRSAGDVPTAYVCRRYCCSLPVTDSKQLEDILDQPTSSG